VNSISKTNPFGLESFIKMFCLCITKHGSLTGSCVNYIKLLHDIMSYKALCHLDFHDVTERHFVVDTKSPTGVSIRNKREYIISNSMSPNGALSLSASGVYQV
jgi:hypothetical protein